MELNTGDGQLNYLLLCVAVGIRVQGVEIWVGLLQGVAGCDMHQKAEDAIVSLKDIDSLIGI